MGEIPSHALRLLAFASRTGSAVYSRHRARMSKYQDALSYLIAKSMLEARHPHRILPAGRRALWVSAKGDVAGSSEKYSSLISALKTPAPHPSRHPQGRLAR